MGYVKDEQVRRAEAVERGNPHPKRVLGKTEPTSRGYWVQLSIVQYEHMGPRVRIELLQHDQFVRHLDLSSSLAEGLHELLGASLLELQK